MRYLPHTAKEIEQMLQVIGVSSIDELFETIPEQARLHRPLAMDEGMDEMSLMRWVEQLAEDNRGTSMLSFLGAGIYDHHVPPTVDQLLLRSELYTAYTPYQPEVSQGTLQATWEYQTIAAEILGHPIANASMYDGASATAEAVLMARRLTKRDGVLLTAGLHPEYVQTVNTYLSGLIRREDEVTTLTDYAPSTEQLLEQLDDVLDDHTAAVVVGYPDFFGTVRDLAPVARKVHEAGALLVSTTQDPYALALLEPPGEQGADISVAEGQALAVPASYGGPGLGMFACRNDKKYLRQIPGRLVGETVDSNNQRGFVLTLSTREQHIRRERATSNICTNHNLIALALAIRMSLLGKKGFVQTAEHCLAKTHYLKEQIQQLDGYRLPMGDVPTFNEFVVEVRGGDAEALVERIAGQGILAGVPLGRFWPERSSQLLISVTEKHTRQDLDRLVRTLDEAR